jgi:hypothetical protein
MALRSKVKSLSGVGVASLLVLIGFSRPLAAAQTYTYEVLHRHWHGGAPGTLHISPDGISFEERGKKKEADSRSWRYEEIQQLTVSPSELRILTYQYAKWKLGRDREYIFDRLPKNLAVETYPFSVNKQAGSAIHCRGSGGARADSRVEGRSEA